MRAISVLSLAALVLSGSILSGGAAASQGPRPFSGVFEKYVDDLPIPPRIQVGAAGEIEITLQGFQGRLHRDLPETTLFGYNGSFPGPTIEVEKGQPLRVRWKNALPAKHVYRLPLHAMGAELPDVRAVAHLHGGVVEQPSIKDRFHNNDGWPELYTLPGEEQIADYPNQQDARILWYHDHALGTTGRNVAAGLAGMYLIHDDFERSLNLPSGNFDIPLIFSAHGLNADGSLYYTSDVSLEFYGNSVSVNGKLWPRLKVEPRKYRFRMLTAANARSFAMKLLDATTMAPGPAIHQIGSDAGFLDHTVVLNDPADPSSRRLSLAPGERADVIIDFSGYAGKQLFLGNNSLDPGDGEMPIPYMMLFDVGTKLSAPDTSSIPGQIRPLTRMSEAAAATTRRITLSRVDMAGGGQMVMLNGKSWSDPISERPLLGSTEIWELVNPLPDMHPFHVHLVQYQVLDRRPFDSRLYASTGEVKFLGEAQPPEPNEMGWKDVVQTLPGMITRIIMRFEPYAGFYVYHCHNLEHEDMEMMRPFEVIRPE